MVYVARALHGRVWYPTLVRASSSRQGTALNNDWPRLRLSDFIKNLKGRLSREFDEFDFVPFRTARHSAVVSHTTLTCLLRWSIGWLTNLCPQGPRQQQQPPALALPVPTSPASRACSD